MSTCRELCKARKKLAATSLGTQALFGGGYLSGGGGSRAEVDIFDAADGTWSTATLSVSRMRVQAAAAGDSAFFVSGMGDSCGGQCPMVDVYDGQSKTWSVTQLARGRYEFAAVGLGDKLLVTGGKQNGSSTNGSWDLVEVFDTATHTWSSREMPLEARSYVSGAALGRGRAAMHGKRSAPAPPARGLLYAAVAGGDFQNGSTSSLVHFIGV